MARRSRYDRETIVLETIVLPIKLPAHMVAQNAEIESDTLRYALLSR